MNEALFIFHLFVVVGFILGALRLGKNALIALIALQGVLANLFVVKQISLFGLAVTCSDVFAVGGMLGLNLLQEYFGRASAAECVKISFWALLFFSCMSQIHLMYHPTPADTAQPAFQTLLAQSLRIVSASMAAFYLVQQFDVRFFGWMKGSLPVRVGVSLFASQFLDTLLFSFLGLYGFVESIWDVILVSCLMKCMIIACSTPFVLFAKRFVKHDVPI